MMTPNYEEIVQVAIEEGIRIIQTAGRGPDSIKFPDGSTLLSKFKKAGMIVIHKCMSVRHALSAEKSGVDCISLGGFEYGGHVGEDDVTHWVHAPTAARKLKCPFLIAGATSVGSQLAAALAMGACGVEIGTGFMATVAKTPAARKISVPPSSHSSFFSQVECPVPQGIKDAITSPQTDERSTILVLRSLKNSGRFYKNALTKEVRKIENESPGEFKKIAHLMTGKRNKRVLEESGDPDDGAWTCGMAAGMITTVPTCREFVSALVTEACETIQAQQQYVVAKSRL